MDYEELAYWLGAVEEYNRATAKAASGGSDE